MTYLSQQNDLQVIFSNNILRQT